MWIRENNNHGILPALLWKNCSWTKGRESYIPLGAIPAIWKLYLLPPGWPQVYLRVSDGEAISQACYFNWTESHDRTSQKKIFHIASVVTFYQFLWIHLQNTINEQSVLLCTVKCVIPPQIQQTNAAGGTREWTVVTTWLMEAKKDEAVLLFEGSHNTQTYPLPFLVGIQLKQSWGNSQQKAGEHSMSAANKQLMPLMFICLSCSRTIAFLLSSCVIQSLFSLFS